MTSGHENGVSPENQPTRHQERSPSPASAEAAYERLTCYGFARRYAQGKTVADIGREEIGYGLRLLAQSAESVTALTELPEVAELASGLYSAPNVNYQESDLPKLALPKGRFDVVVAFGVIEDLEHPQELVVEAKRLLKEDGVLLISVADKKQTAVNDRAGIDGGRRGMYVPEFRELLKRHFEHVRLYRQGAVAGGLVFPLSEELTGATVPVESIRLSSSGPHLGVESPTTRSVMAVCSDAAEAHGGEEERAYLLVDRDRRVFDESEERAEDVELMQDEIRRMQETEVQAFVEAIKVRQSLVRELLQSPYSYRNLIIEEIRYRQSIIRGNMYALRQKDARGLAKGILRRISVFYRRLREGQKP